MTKFDKKNKKTMKTKNNNREEKTAFFVLLVDKFATMKTILYAPLECIDIILEPSEYIWLYALGNT